MNRKEIGKALSSVSGLKLHHLRSLIYFPFFFFFQKSDEQNKTGSQEGNQKLQQSLRKLSNLILCDSPQDLRTRASWDGTIPARAEEPNGISQDEEEKDKAKDGRKKRKNGKGGVQGRSREKVLDQIRRYIAPDVLVPENRLKCLQIFLLYFLYY